MSNTYRCPLHGVSNKSWMIFYEGEQETAFCTLCLRDFLIASFVPVLEKVESDE